MIKLSLSLVRLFNLLIKTPEMELRLNPLEVFLEINQQAALISLVQIMGHKFKLQDSLQIFLERTLLTHLK